jgi:hypothetical protein
MITRSSLKTGHLRLKTRSQELKIERLVNTLGAAVFIQIFWKFVRKVVLIISRSTSKMGYLRSKTRSRELKIEKACKHASGCSIDSNILQICQECCFDDFWVKCYDWPCLVKN